MLVWVPILSMFVTVSASISTQASAVTPSPETPAAVDIREIWQNGLNKKKAAARGLDPKAIKTPKKIRNVAPDYPVAAMRAGQTGSVVLECRIDTDGVPRNCSVVESVAPLLDASALACVAQWRYKPLTLHGEPRPALVNLTVSFRLN